MSNNLMMIILFIVMGVCIAVVFYLIRKSNENNVGLIGKVSKDILAEVNNQISDMRRDLNDRLKETSQAITETHKTVGNRLDNATKIYGDVANTLGKLQEANQQLLEVGRSIAGLQELLRAPKFRGELGEDMLENILAQVLPKEYYQLQYRFRTGETVDAVIRLAGHLVPVDSKFSMENFQKMMAQDNENERNMYRKNFIRDVKKRIDEVASKYILPDEGTFDFALMYIYAEGVYYETIIKEDLLKYALQKKVIPVSPNTFYAYLQVICLGLRGMKIESNIKRVIDSLSRLQIDLGKFKEDFRVMGGHLRNAATKYEEADRKLERFSDKLTSIEQTKQVEKLEE